jgi:uncharacterized protein YqiB (DUF1249 family)
MSLDHLVISNNPRRAVRADKLVMIPTPDSIQLRFYRDADLAEMVEIDQSRLYEELERLIAEFR